MDRANRKRKVLQNKQRVKRPQGIRERERESGVGCVGDRTLPTRPQRILLFCDLEVNLKEKIVLALMCFFNLHYIHFLSSDALPSAFFFNLLGAKQHNGFNMSIFSATFN